MKYSATYSRYYEIQVFISLSLPLSLPFTYTRYTQVFQLCRLQSSFQYRQPHGHSRALTLTTKRINAAAHLTRIEIFGEYSSLSWSSVLWISVEIFMVQFALLFTPMIRRCSESPVRERQHVLFLSVSLLLNKTNGESLIQKQHKTTNSPIINLRNPVTL
jgi:hypothetical protein